MQMQVSLAKVAQEQRQIKQSLAHVVRTVEGIASEQMNEAKLSSVIEACLRPLIVKMTDAPQTQEQV